MAKKTLMNNFRNGGKPKKRIIFAETPKRTVLENRYLDTRTNKEIPESEFKKRRVVGYNYTGREDLDKAIFEEILDALSSDVNYADFTDYMLSNYGIDFSNKDSFKVRYDSVYNAFGDDFEREIAKFSTELANSSLIKDFANASKEFLKEPVYENAKIEYVEKKVPDNTFVNEAKKAARASMEIDGVPTEIVPFYGEEEFKNISQKYNKNALKNADVILLGHVGSKIAGIENEVWNSYLKENMDKDSTCYGGICAGYAMAIDFKDVPNFTGTISNKWIGIPEYKTFKGKGSFADIFFSNVEDESHQVAAVKPKYGREYANYQKNPELIPTIRDEFGRIVRSSQLVEIPTQILSPLQVQPPAQIPTLRTQVRMQDGGNIKKYQNSGQPVQESGDIKNTTPKFVISEKTPLDKILFSFYGPKSNPEYNPQGPDSVYDIGDLSIPLKRDIYNTWESIVRHNPKGERNSTISPKHKFTYHGDYNLVSYVNMNGDTIVLDPRDYNERVQRFIKERKEKSFTNKGDRNYLKKAGGFDVRVPGDDISYHLSKSVPNYYDVYNTELQRPLGYYRVNDAEKPDVSSVSFLKPTLASQYPSFYREKQERNRSKQEAVVDNIYNKLADLSKDIMEEFPQGGNEEMVDYDNYISNINLDKIKDKGILDKINLYKELKKEYLKEESKYYDIFEHNVKQNTNQLHPGVNLYKNENNEYVNGGNPQNNTMKNNKTYRGINKYQQGGKNDRDILAESLEALNIPQKELMNILFGERKSPSELLTGDELGSKLMGRENYGLLADLLLDPLNLIPLSKAKYLLGFKGEKQKQKLSNLSKIGNILWAADKVNDIQTAITSDAVYPYTQSFLKPFQQGGNPQNNTMKNTKFPTLGRFMYQQGGNIKKYQNSGFADNNSLDCIEIGGKTFCKRPGKENEGYYLKEGNFYYRAPNVYAKDEDRPYDYDTQGNKTEQYGWSPSSPMGEEELDYMKKQRQYIRGEVIPYDEFTNPDYKYPNKYEFKGKDFELDYYKFLHDKHNKYGKEYFHPEDLEDYYRYYEKNKKKFNEKSNEGIKPNIYERRNGGLIKKYQGGGQPSFVVKNESNHYTNNTPRANWYYQEFLSPDKKTRFVKKTNQYYAKASNGLWYPVNMNFVHQYATNQDMVDEQLRTLETYYANNFRKEGGDNYPYGITEAELYEEYGYPYLLPSEKKEDYLYDLYKLHTEYGDSALREEDVEQLKQLESKQYEKLKKRYKKEQEDIYNKQFDTSKPNVYERKNGGMITKFMYQQGGYGQGYGELQGDAGKLLREIMMGTTTSGMFDKQTGTYSKISTADYLKEKGYSAPYAKKDWIGNTVMYVKDPAGNEVKVKDFDKEVEAYNAAKATEFKSNQEQFNKFLPLTQNLAGLFDLQQREQEEIANKKLTVRDFPTSNSTYAPVGFAQDGGGMQSAQDPMPSLQAIMNGLPRGMSKKHKEMVKNNADKELFVMQQALGYKDNSPFRNLPEQDIYSDTIDMNNVSIPLAAISDNSIAKILPPNSGTHIFKGAQVVKEIPVDMAQQGMLVQDDNQEMIIGVIDLLRQIEDPQNRQEVAIKKLEELLAEGIQVDQEAFMQAVMEDGNNIKDDEEEDDDSISMEEVDEDSFEMVDEVEEMRDGGMPQRYKDMGFTKVNTPKRTPNHGSKSHAVVVKDGSSYKLIRFGQKGVSGSPRKPGESEAYRKRRESFKARHAKNIAKGKTSAAYWADKVKWEDGGMPNVGMTMPQYMNSGFAKSNYNNGDASALFINTPLAKNGFFSRLGKGIKKVARGVGNAFHDWGMMLADNVGNEFGIYDIDNERYKTKFGRSLAGINEKIQPVVGKIKGAIASAAVPGMSGVFNLKNSMGAGMNQQQSAAASPYGYSPNFAMPQNNNADQLRMLMNFAPMLLGSQNPFSSEAGSQMLPGFFQNGGGSDEEPKRMSSSINNMQGIIGEAPTNMSERMPSYNMSYRQTSASSKAPTAGRKLTGQDRELTNQYNYLADLQQYVMTYGLSALEKTDPEAADFYTNAALLAANNYNNEDEEEDDNDIILPEIVKTAKRPDNKKGTKAKKSKEYEYNSYLELEFPKSKSDFLLNNFGIKFSDIGKSVNANMDDSLANLTNVLRNLLSRDSQVLIYDPRNVAQSPTIYGPTASAKNGLMVRKYKQGGSVFNKDLVANDDSMAKHYLPIPLMIPIQTEIKETIVLPTKDLVKVNAKKRHSKMSDNEVTDVVPENSYILSQFGDTKIYKDEANQIVMEMKAEPYNLHKASAVPKVRTLGDMMNKNVMSPADLSRVVSNKFKIIDNGDDPFTIQTNEANRFNRAAYLEAIIGLSEYDKARKGIDNSISAQTQAGQLPQMVARQGGFAKPLVMNGGVLPKAVDPLSLALSAAPQIISTAFDIGANIADRNRLKKNTRLNAADISRYANTARQNLGLSAMTQGLFTAMQDTNIIPELKDVNYLDAINNMNMAYVNTAANRLASDAFSNRLDVSSMSPQSAMYLAGRDTAQRYEALGKASADLAKTRADLFTKYMMTRGELLNENAGMRAKAANLRTAAQNAKLGTFGGIFSGYLDNLTGVTKNEIEANMANRGNYAARLSDLNSSLGQSLQNTANVIAQSQNRSKTESEARVAEKKAKCAEIGGQWIIHPDGFQECSK